MLPAVARPSRRPGRDRSGGHARHRIVLIAWAAVILALGAIGMGIDKRLAPVSIVIDGTPTAEASKMLKERFGESVQVAVLLQGPPEEVDRQGRRLVATLRATGHTQVLSPWQGGGATRSLRPEPGAALIPINFLEPEDVALTKVVPEATRIVSETIEPPVESHLSGLSVVARSLKDQSLESTHQAELMALPILVIVLLLVFRTPIAAAVPLLMGGATVFAGRGLLVFATNVFEVNSLGVSMTSMMGLALGVDYALLMVSRYRQEREAGRGPEAGLAAARSAAGRTIVFAGGTLAVVMLTAALTAPGGLLGSVAAGVAIAGVLSVALAVSAMPALLHEIGPHLERWRMPSLSRGGRGGWALALSGRLVSRPALTIPLILALVLALGAPALAVQLGPPDVRQLPEDDPARESFEAVQEVVSPGWSAPFVVAATSRGNVISEPKRLRALGRWQARISRMPGVAAVIGPADLGGSSMMATARRTYREAPDRLDAAEEGLGSLREGLRRASAGIAELREGMAAAADAAGQLHEGAGETRSGAAELSSGLAEAEAGSRKLSAGLDRAVAGAEDLLAGQRRLGSGADQLARGVAELDRAVREALGPVREISRRLAEWAEWIAELQVPAELAVQRLEEALAALEEMTVGRDDPRYQELLEAVREASLAVGGPGRIPQLGSEPIEGSGPVLLDVLEEIQAELSSALEALAALPDGLESFTDGIARLREGADRLAAGTDRAELGTERLRDGLRELAQGGRRLEDGLGELHAGAGELGAGLGELQSGSGQLARGLAAGHRRSAPLATGLDSAQEPLGRFQTALHGAGRRYRKLDSESPGAIDSGYLLLTVLDGTLPGVRDLVAQTINIDDGGESARIMVVSETAPGTAATERLSNRLQSELPRLARASDTNVEIGHGAQALLDYANATMASLPMLAIALTLVAAAMLVAVLRALLLPIVAVGLTLLTIGAAFGVLELLIQLGVLPGPEFIDAVSAAGIFAIMFVLAIDYEVFLLTRMRESWVTNGDHRLAIKHGLHYTANVITGAAAIMSGVFLAFGAAGLASLSQFGIGLTVAVLLDATVVRLVLLPAVMRAIGPRVWWLPDWLDRRLPNIEHGGPSEEELARLDGAEPESSAAAEAARPSEPSGGTGPHAIPGPARSLHGAPVRSPGREPDLSPGEKLGAATHAEHCELIDLLGEIDAAGQRRDTQRLGELARTAQRIAIPHFHYEQEALFPHLTEVLGAGHLRRLRSEQDAVTEALDRIATFAGSGELDRDTARQTRRLVQSAVASVASCDGLNVLVERQPAPVAEEVLAMRQRAFASRGHEPPGPGL